MKLVDDALNERGVLLHIAPHLVHPIPLVVPLKHYWEIPRIWIGIKMYDWLAGPANISNSYYISKKDMLQKFPNLNADHLAAGIVYYDGEWLLR